MLNNQYNGNFILQKSSSEEQPEHGESDDQHQLKPVARSRTVSILCILLVMNEVCICMYSLKSSVYVVFLAVILIWRFGNFGFDCQV